MKIGAQYSHLNGFETLMYHRPQLWREIEGVINSVDASKFKTKKSNETKNRGKLLYSPKKLNLEFKRKFNSKKWYEYKVSFYTTNDPVFNRQIYHLATEEQKNFILAQGKEAFHTSNQIDFFKDKVSIEIQFGKYAFVAHDIFVKHMNLFTLGKIRVGVEILPMKSMQSEMSTGVPNYEGFLSNFHVQGLISPAVPIIIVGIEP